MRSVLEVSAAKLDPAVSAERIIPANSAFVRVLRRFAVFILTGATVYDLQLAGKLQ
jgi:hypothetical protein